MGSATSQIKNVEPHPSRMITSPVRRCNYTVSVFFCSMSYLHSTHTFINRMNWSSVTTNYSFCRHGSRDSLRFFKTFEILLTVSITSTDLQLGHLFLLVILQDSLRFYWNSLEYFLTSFASSDSRLH